jgi:hypothetical protein
MKNNGHESYVTEHTTIPQPHPTPKQTVASSLCMQFDDTPKAFILSSFDRGN